MNLIEHGRQYGTQLRMISPSRAVYSSSSTGIGGVFYEKRRKKRRVQIGFRGKLRFLGYYFTKEEAIRRNETQAYNQINMVCLLRTHLSRIPYHPCQRELPLRPACLRFKTFGKHIQALLSKERRRTRIQSITLITFIP